MFTGIVERTVRVASVSEGTGFVRLNLAIDWPDVKNGEFVAPRGSVALDGVSLTVARVYADRFDAALIPTTLKMTTLGTRAIGWPFNFEADILSKTVVSYLERTRLGD